MSKQAIIELLNSKALKYRKAHSRKAKGELIKQLMELTGYKSAKSIIRYYSRIRKRKRVEKRGRLPKLQLNDIELIKTIWLKFDQPSGRESPRGFVEGYALSGRVSACAQQPLSALRAPGNPGSSCTACNRSEGERSPVMLHAKRHPKWVPFCMEEIQRNMASMAYQIIRLLVD